MIPTQRTYRNKLTGETFRFYVDPFNSYLIELLSEQTGEKCTHFILAAHTSIDFKFNDKKVVRLDAGEMLPIDSTNLPTHKKFFMQKRFQKY
jgi:hypothetical protein